MRDWGPHRLQLPAEQAFAAEHADPSMPPISYGGISRRALLAGTAGALAEVALSLMGPSANAQVTGQTPALGRQILGPVLSQPGWSKWIEVGQIAPLYEGEIALLSSIEATPAFGANAEARARQIAADVRTMRPNAEPAYLTAFLAFAGLQSTTVFRQWHQASYEKYPGHSEYPSGDDPYIWRMSRSGMPSSGWN